VSYIKERKILKKAIILKLKEKTKERDNTKGKEKNIIVREW